MNQKTNRSGRPKGTGKWGVETRPMRVPVSIWDKVVAFIKKELQDEENRTPND